MFVDKVKIKVVAGNGGNGVVSFHREKYIASGGPDGGDGGRGGDIILKADSNMSTLMDFRYKRKYTAGNGMDGTGKRCTGKDGESLVIRVPRGTVVRDAETNAIIRISLTMNRMFLQRAETAAGAISILPHLPVRLQDLQKAVLQAKARKLYLNLNFSPMSAL